MSNTASESKDQSTLVVDGRVVVRRGECERCGEKLFRHPRGRPPRFCGGKCKQAAHREAHSETNMVPGKGLLRNGGKNPTQSGVSDPKNGGRRSSFSVPVNLLGGYQFPNAKPVDPNLVATILRTESRLLSSGRNTT